MKIISFLIKIIKRIRNKKMDKNKIENKIVNFFNSLKIFTAFDVTKSLREDDYYVKHGEVKDVLSHIDLAEYDYERTVSKNPDLSPKPFIYHSLEHSDADVKEYEDELLKVTSPSPVVDNGLVLDDEEEDDDEDDEEYIKLSDKTSDDIEIDDESITLKTDVRNRCAIPNRIVLRKFTLGTKVGVLFDPDENTTIIEEVDEDGLYDAILTVDKSGNIRIPSEYLVGLNVKVSYDWNKIILS
jgi:hypothetical protein